MLTVMSRNFLFSDKNFYPNSAAPMGHQHEWRDLTLLEKRWKAYHINDDVRTNADLY